MVTKKQIEECLSILITRVDTINDRTKIHTKDIKENAKEIRELNKSIKTYINPK